MRLYRLRDGARNALEESLVIQTLSHHHFTDLGDLDRRGGNGAQRDPNLGDHTLVRQVHERAHALTGDRNVLTKADLGKGTDGAGGKASRKADRNNRLTRGKNGFLRP